LETIWQGVVDLIPEDATGTLLEVGCGAGQLLERLAEQRPNLRCSALDIVPENVVEAQRRAPQTDVFLGDLWPTLAAGPTWDYIISVGALFSTTDIMDVDLLFNLVNARARKGFIILCMKGKDGLPEEDAKRLMAEAVENSVNISLCYVYPRTWLPTRIMRQQCISALLRGGTKALLPIPTVPDELLGEPEPPPTGQVLELFAEV